jgi:hypothetical protein
MKADDFLKEDLYWRPHQELPYYYCYFNGTPILLRMNNSPDEPPYTFTYLLNVIHLDDLPKNWKIEHPK